MTKGIKYVDVIYSQTGVRVQLRCGPKMEVYDNVPNRILVRLARWADTNPNGRIVPRWTGWTWQAL